MSKVVERTERCWLVGRSPDTGGLCVVEGERVGEERDGEQLVDIRPDCPRSKVLVPVQAERVFSSWKLAEERRRKGWWDEG